MRKRIERSALEMIEFFEEIHWSIRDVEQELIKSADYINEYSNYYKFSEEEFEKAEKVINFFYEPESEPMPFGIFWNDDDKDSYVNGFMEINPKYPKQSVYKYRCYQDGIIYATYDNFKEIKDIEELKEYYK
jgi:hypothetical protein